MCEAGVCVCSNCDRESCGGCPTAHKTKEVMPVAQAAKEHDLDVVAAHEFDRMYREHGIAVLCEDGHAVRLFKEV